MSADLTPDEARDDAPDTAGVAVAVTPARPEPSPGPAIEGRSPWQLAWIHLRKDRAAMISLAFILLLALVSVSAPLLAHWIGWSPTDQDRTQGLTVDGLPVGPSGRHLLGTDNLGRDILVRVLYGSQVSLLVGVVSTLLAVAMGVLVGLVAGYFGSAVDTVLSRVMDLVLSFPFLLFAIALVSIFGSSLAISVFVIAFFSWAAVGRIVRGQTLSIREKEYIEAARSLGANDLRIMFVDVLPNLLAPVIVYTTLLIPIAIVFEATLSFLGLGVVPPSPTWGNMLSDSLDFYQVSWWFPLFPGLALLLTTLAFNLLGDGVRDALDPRAERLFQD
ncbi:ABC transporter permease [Streptacidiphilus anmyonensis]|uniref:ABC transporter permease n=1 Tax=Streptacidiphilus anmyonensis TaxID=405782 RepID=UPI0005AB6BE2|nr:ABC transporter permease [Streptacidiphilus anmyonensis]